MVLFSIIAAKDIEFLLVESGSVVFDLGSVVDIRAFSLPSVGSHNPLESPRHFSPYTALVLA